jgi:hypothetical protein
MVLLLVAGKDAAGPRWIGVPRERPPNAATRPNGSIGTYTVAWRSAWRLLDASAGSMP